MSHCHWVNIYPPA